MADFIAPPADTLTAESLGNALRKPFVIQLEGECTRTCSSCIGDRGIDSSAFDTKSHTNRAGFFSIAILSLGLLPLPQGDPDAAKVKNPIASTPEIDCCRQAGLRQVRIVLRR
jgi:hypothetical protein